MLQLIAGIMRLEFPDVTDPPDVIANAIGGNVFPFKLLSRDFLADGDRFQHRTVGKPAAADIIDFARSWGLKTPVKGAHEVRAMHVVAYLLAFIAKDLVRSSGEDAAHQIGQESVELCARMIRPGKTAGAKTSRY